VVPASGVLEDAAGNALADAQGNTPPAGASLLAPETADGAPPVPRAEFDGDTVIRVVFGEALREAASAVAGAAYSVTAGGSAVPLSADPAHATSYDAPTRTLTLTLAAAAQDGVEHTVAIPAMALADAQGNFVEDDPVAAPGPASGTHFTAITLSATQTLVTFSSMPEGTLAAGAWTITEGTADIGVTGVARAAGTVTSEQPRALAASLVLAHAPLSTTAATPLVSYDGDTGDLAVAGEAVPSDEDTADDGAPPVFAATLGSTARLTDVTVTFSEPVTLAEGKGLPASTDWLLSLNHATDAEGNPVPVRTFRLSTPPAWSPAAPTEAAPAASISFSFPRAPVAVEFSPQGEGAAGSLVDAVGLPLAAGTSDETADTQAPRLLGARLDSSTEIRATFSEAVRLTAFAQADWVSAGTTFSGARVVGEEVVLTASRPTNPTSVAAGATLAYSGGAVTDIAGNAAPDSSPALADAAGPEAASARFADADTVEVTFGEAVAAPPAAALLLRGAGGEVAARATGTPSVSTPTGAGAAADSLLTFDISPEAAGGLRDGAYTFHATRELTDAHVPPNAYQDGRVMPPSLTLDTAPTLTASFAGPRTITLAASEALAPATVTAGAFAVAGPDGTAVDVAGARYSAGSPPHVALTLGADAAAGEHVITPATSITDADATPTPYAGGAIRATYDAAAPPPFTAATRSATETVVTFGGELSGTLDAASWAVTDDDDSVMATDEARAVTHVEVLSGGVASGRAEPGSPAAITATGATSILITHAGLDSTASTPEVAYARPAQAPPGGHLSAGGEEAADSMAEASDGAPPTMVARTSAAGMTAAEVARLSAVTGITVTFSETVGGTTSLGSWDVGGLGLAVSPLTLGTETGEGVTLRVAEADDHLAQALAYYASRTPRPRGPSTRPPGQPCP